MRSTRKPPRKVYYVEDCYTSPGRIYAIFDKRADAERFAEQLLPTQCLVSPRTLYYGQPPNRGFNP